MAEIKVIEGEVFVDHRGEILSANNLDFAEIRRSYTITNANTDVIRGWHGHQDEKKMVLVYKGWLQGRFCGD